jgi:uncharacterized protein involved in cysteine biosynthesis
MLTPLLLAFRQLTDPAMLGPVLKGALVAFLAFAGLAGLAAWGLDGLVGQWLPGLATALGGILALGLATWLFVPVMLLGMGLFLDGVAAAVERRWYPGLPPAAGAGPLAQMGLGLRLGLRFGLLYLLALPVALLAPPVGTLLLWLIGAFALGHGLFEGVALRRLPAAEARAARRAREIPVLVTGTLLAGLASLPLVNLLVPCLGAAAMTHLLHQPLPGNARPGRDFPR